MMRRKTKREKKGREKKKRIRLENRFVILTLVGAVFVGALILLQTRFAEYMRLDNAGFAVAEGAVSTGLGKAPEDESIEKEVAMCSFDALDMLFSQGERLFLGSGKKIQIDSNYPVYLKNGAVVQVVNDAAVLLDDKFEEVSTYRGLMVEDGTAYNADGGQADAATYYFFRFANGCFMNFKEISYTQKGTEKNIAVNSLVHFETDYFAYYEIEENTLLYKYYNNVPENLIMQMDGKEYTYEELLKALGMSKNERKQTSKQPGDTETAEEVTDDIYLEQADVVVEENVSDGTSTAAETPKRRPTEDPGGGEPGNGDPGVRPDSMRPDKVPDDDGGGETKVPEVGYVKPTVSVGDFTAFVYRLKADVKVDDPAKRIDETKQIQFEVYEVDNKGRETLVLRSYRKSSGTVELGGGSIKPSSTYHVKYFFTYWNEYNESVFEDLGEQTVTTKSVDTLGSITLAHRPGTSYNNRIEIEGFSYVDGSDTEAVYGVDRAAGIRIVVTPQSGVGAGTTLNLNSSEISKFKRQSAVTLTTMPVLSAKTTYHYKITAKDYFGNTLTLVNDEGSATTSNHTPEAKFNIRKNEINDLQLLLTVNDEDGAAVVREGSANECDIYYVVTTDRRDLSSAADLSKAVYSYKLNSSEYSWSADQGLSIRSLALPQVTGLELETKYFATIYCDYDLGNGKGPQRFQNIGQMSFTSAGLNSLGRVYLTCTVSDVTSNSAMISYKLNTKSTNSELTKLITRLSAEVKTGAGDDERVDAVIGFDKNAVVDENGTQRKVYEQFREGIAVGYRAQGLTSMTEYFLDQHIYAEYNGKEYELIPNISDVTFMTLRKPAEVKVDDLLFAAGTLIFDVRVDDPDDAITGISGDKVVVNLYTSDGVFVKATRIKKNQDLTVTFKNLDVNKKYQLRFIAVEYNEGYTNSTFESNKVLKTIDVTDAMRLSGTIKLQEIVEVRGDNAHYTACVKSTLKDPDHWMTGADALPYYIRIEKDGALVTNNVYRIDAESSDGVYIHNYNYQVDKGEHSYKLTLYVIVGTREMELDTLEFTTETTVQGFGTAYEMIDKIKKDPDGKFVATADIVLSGNNENYRDLLEDGTPDTSSPSLAGSSITSVFGGEVDFQGFTLEHHYNSSGQRIITNMGSGSKWSNMRYQIYQENTTRIYDDGCLCYRNFGTISDILVEFKGGYFLPNQYMGLITRVNAATGVIENFVIKNDPQEGYNGVTAYNYVGLVTADNYGLIQSGYVYGSSGNENIECTAYNTGALDRRVAGIAGTNNTVGRIQNIYSLINVNAQSADQKTGTKANDTRFGSICGYSSGNTRQMYSIGESFPKVTSCSPVVYNVGGKRYGKLYYWNSNNTTYTAAQSKKLTIENLYDTGWQRSVLGDNFDVTTAEVGYYPHVLLSEDLPEQEYIALPDRVTMGDIEISQAEVLKYYTLENGLDAADVKIVFSNRQGLDITGLEIQDLSVKLDSANAETEDGYTTIYGTISDPQSFQSEYLITRIFYVKSGTAKEYTLSTPFTLAADFYRRVANADEWYEYVVLKNKANKTENIRLTADIDFDGISADRIIVPNSFPAKLDGNGKTISNINLQKGYTANNNISRDLFNAGTSLASGGEVSNLYVKNYKAGGTFTKNGVQYVACYGGLFRCVEGVVENVHLQNVEINSYIRMGAIAATLQNGGEITDCTVTGSVKLTYLEPDNVNSDISMGGIVGHLTDSRISHCLATDLDMNADQMRGSNGVGGVVGYSSNSVIDTAYAEGDLVTRASKVGGVAGKYYCTNASVACVKNIYSKMNLICNTDIVGGLLGEANITTNVINNTNNMSGLAVGNVYVSNPDSVNISHTVGQYVGKGLSFYGTEMQLVNGMADVQEDALVMRGLLTYDQLTKDAFNSYRKVVGFENVYSMSGTEKGYLPKMCYENSSKILPNQKNIKLDEIDEYEIDVRHVFINSEATRRSITVELYNPNGYTITGMGIEQLKYHYLKQEDGQSGLVPTDNILEAQDSEKGITRIYMQYEEEKNQEHFLDSYVLRNISFDTGGGKAVKMDVYARIDATLYRDINSVGDWNRIGDYAPYENYRLLNDLDFANYSDFGKNYLVGRLCGSGNKVISNVNVTGSNTNLIARLNSRIENITIEKSSVSTTTNDCIGFVGISSARVKNCTFREITITPGTANKSYVGMIGYQNGGAIEGVTCENITINGQSKTGIDRVGAICGQVMDTTEMKDITANQITVSGRNYIGGLFGFVAKADIDNVVLNDIKVDANSYAGGFAAYVGETDNCNSAKMTNLTLTGTPVIVDDKITGSSTVISAVSYCGGLFGYTRETTGTNAADAVDGATVTGCQVVGSGTDATKEIYVGGAYGYNRYGGYHITVKDSLVQAKEGMAIGGIVGRNDASGNRYLLAENVLVETENAQQVGGIIGQAYNGEIAFALCKNSTISAKGDDHTKGMVGGVAGRVVYASIRYSGTINTMVDAETQSYVGGALGWFSYGPTNGPHAMSLYVLGDTDIGKADTNEAAVSEPDYYVKGYDFVGGIVGRQYGGYVYDDYANIHVSAANGYAGGIAGSYNNAYTAQGSNKSYSVSKLYKNYFVGTVEGVKAGGIVGRNELYSQSQSTTGNRVKDGADKNSNLNEKDATYGNLSMAASVTGSAGAGAFSAETPEFVGRDNRIWDGMKVNGTTADMLSGSNNGYAYRYWSATTANMKPDTSSPQRTEELVLFKAGDLKADQTKLDANGYLNKPLADQRAILFYRQVQNGFTGSYNANMTELARGDYWRISLKNMRDKFEDSGRDQEDYLPQMRSGTNTKYSADYCIRQQSQIMTGTAEPGRLPIPTYDTARAASTMYALTGETSMYGIIYASDVDKVNVEFSKDLQECGYFILKSGKDVITKQKIVDRVMSFTFDYNDKLTLTWGLFENPSLEGEELWEEDNLWEMETRTADRNHLARNIMVDGNDYYYISEDGVVSSGGTHSGDFLMLMNGKALDEDGVIWNVADWSKAGNVSGTAVQKETQALFTFKYGSYAISTYARCSCIASAGGEIYREAQIFVTDGRMYTVAGELENQKDGILLYTLNGTGYETILGDDGIVVDMMQQDANLPKEVQNKAIVQMTNTINAKVPYVILEYSNGGMVGYNYATGEILFDNRIASQVSLADYAKQFFEGVKESVYHGISTTYSANAELSERIHSSAELEQIVGNNSGEQIDDHSRGENTAEAGGATAAADPEHSAMADSDKIGSGDASGTSAEGTAVDGAGGSDGVGGSAGASEAGDADVESDGSSGADAAEAGASSGTDAAGAGASSGTSTDGDASADPDKIGTSSDDPDKTGTSSDDPDRIGSDGADVASDGSSGAGTSGTGDGTDITGDFMTVYNPQTGRYEIVSVDKYLTDVSYVSENERLGVSDLPKSSGYAVAKVDKTQEGGMLIYIVAASAIILLTLGVAVYMGRKHKK